MRSTRAVLAAEYSATLSPAGVQGDLIRALVEQSKDPDTDVPTWLMGATPICILRSITLRGIFPLTEAAAESPEEIWRLSAGNYSSYAEF